MDTNAYLSFLAIGVLMVVVDGQIIYRSGKRYLENSRGNPEAAASMTRLVTVLFHLAVLGLLALISTIDYGGSSIQAVVGRLGVLLLVIALAHGITIGVLARMREEQAVEDATRREAPVDRQLAEPVVAPVPGQQGRAPQVSPNLEHGSPYRADQV